MNDVSIIRCGAYELDEVIDALRRLFALHGGLSTIIKPRQRVLVKPNLICGDGIDSGATTHPILLEALIILIKECDAYPSVGDGPAFGSARGVARIIGLDRIAERHTVPIVEFSSNHDVYRHRVNAGSFLKSFTHPWQHKVRRLSYITKTINDFDLIINVPKLKAHCQMMMSGAVKNVYGFISGKPKAYRHFCVKKNIELFSLAVLAMHDRVRPDFTIVDAIDVMEVTGPRHGVVKRRGLLFGGTDAMCIDAIIAHLMGIDIETIPLLRYARTYGYGTTDVQCINVRGDIDAHLQGFQLPSQLEPISFSLKTVITSVFWHFYLLFKEKKDTKSEYI